MQIVPPNLPIGQKFGENADGAYKADGLLGHPGIDFGGTINWGNPILCATEGGIVSALLSENDTNLEAYRAVNTIFEDSTGCYEVQYGHVSTINVKVGDSLIFGQTVAEIGNTGDVYTGSPAILVTDAQKQLGSHAGAHIHLQVRVIAKELATGQLDTNKHYVNDGVGLLTLNGYRYFVPNWNNGYNGCIDPALYFHGNTEEQTPADKLVAIANSMMGTNPTQARIILAVAGLVHAFS